MGSLIAEKREGESTRCSGKTQVRSHTHRESDNPCGRACRFRRVPRGEPHGFCALSRCGDTPHAQRSPILSSDYLCELSLNLTLTLSERRDSSSTLTFAPSHRWHRQESCNPRARPTRDEPALSVRSQPKPVIRQTATELSRNTCKATLLDGAQRSHHLKVKVVLGLRITQVARHR